MRFVARAVAVCNRDGGAACVVRILDTASALSGSCSAASDVVQLRSFCAYIRAHACGAAAAAAPANAESRHAKAEVA